MNSMDSKFGLIQLGSCVEIKHSSGRTHQAVVTKLHESTSSVTVEWLEKGTNRAKEVDLQLIFDLNPHLAPRSRSTSSAETSLTARGNQSLVSERLPQLIKVDKCWDSRSPVVARPQSRTRRTSPCMWQMERLPKQQECHHLDMQEKPAQKDSVSLRARTDVVAMIQEYRKHLNGKAPLASMPCQPCRITVCIRKRPLNQWEAKLNDIDVVTVSCQGTVVMHEAKQKLDLTQYLNNQIFCFDRAFDDHATNELVYKHTAQPLVDIIFQGGMATCFAYGQTGSGKTHTMQGSISSKGIYVLVAEDVFHRLQCPCYQELGLWVYGAFFEIYRGKVFDLLNRKKQLRVLENAKKQTQVIGLCEEEVCSVEDVIRLIETGSNCRRAGQSSSNTQSSRSHAVFQIILKKREQLYAKFSLVDLAGNERGHDITTADKKMRLEGADINKSLLALKECIRALGHKKAHTPFRANKLTQVLKDSFIGKNSYTCMIATISPGLRSCEHTLDTLRYANRVKELVVDISSLKQPFPIVSSLPQQQQFGVQADKEVLSKALNSNAGGKTLTKRKEINEETLTERHQKFLCWLKEFLKVAEGTSRNVHMSAAQFVSALNQEIGILTKIRDEVILFQSAACTQE